MMTKTPRKKARKAAGGKVSAVRRQSANTVSPRADAGWPGARGRIRRGFPQADAAEVLESLDWFERHLGSDWLGWEERHPLAGQFLLAVGGLVYEGARLRKLAGTLEEDPVLRDLVRRLGGPDWAGYYSAVTELEMAAGMHARGCAVNLVLPTPGGTRKPDFQASICDRAVNCECTALVDSEPERMANHVFDHLFFYPSASLKKPVRVLFESNARADEAFCRLSELEQGLVSASVEDRAVTVRGLAQFEPFGGADHFPTVVVEGGLGVGGVEKPLIQLGRAIRKKLNHGQLDAATPGLLIVRTRSISLFASRALRLWLAAIAEEIQTCLEVTGALVSAVLVYERWRGATGGELSFSGQGYAAVADHDGGGVNRLAVLVLNPKADCPLSDDEAARLVGPSMVW